MKQKIISAILVCALLLSLCTAVSAAEIERAGTGANIEAAIVAADYAEVGGTLEPEEVLPSSYNSAALGYTTPVRNQNYNTCWAYSSTASFESLLLKNRISSFHLSPMHMNFWGCTREDDTGWQRDYYQAGYPYIALGYLTSYGCVPDSVFDDKKAIEDYAASSGSVYPYRIADGIIYLEAADRDTVKTAVYNYGGVIGNFHYSTFLNESDNGTAYFCNQPDLATSQLNGHAVEIVGWDDNYSKTNFKSESQPTADGAWLCKNSWGTGWCNQKGYFWISYEDYYLFDSRFGPSYAITSSAPMTAVSKMQQNEEYGSTYEFSYIEQLRPNQTKMTYANVFDFSDGYHNIDKVVFESTSQGSKYTIYYIPVNSSGAPVTDTTQWMLLAKGTVEYEGYTGAEIYGFDAPKTKGAIGVQIEKNGDTGITIGSDEWLTSGGKYLFKPTSQRGQSYLIGYTTNAMDVMDFYKNKLSDDIGGTFVIKALCRNDEKAGDVDRDKDFSILDVTLAQYYHSRLTELDDEQLRYADFNNDGEVDITDCTFMQRGLAYMD
ncbi:MAG: hypothetical protein IJV48_07430 [Ruminococcus sp.]|nr:hypothetical protein [Ruminococcus sp.]